MGDRHGALSRWSTDERGGARERVEVKVEGKVFE
jgi:hypothetical protein